MWPKLNAFFLSCSFKYFWSHLWKVEQHWIFESWWFNLTIYFSISQQYKSQNNLCRNYDLNFEWGPSSRLVICCTIYSLSWCHALAPSSVSLPLPLRLSVFLCHFCCYILCLMFSIRIWANDQEMWPQRQAVWILLLTDCLHEGL